ncbi:MAG TPA: heavy metal translocating P-type ATPase [Nitrospiraceae bacterium]|nr:heavy metal translocating P-type ATPase [Nitrospiraceae bacterium]
MEKSTIGRGRRKEVVHRSPSGLEAVRQQLDSLPKINGKKAHMRNLSHGAKTLAVDVDTTKIAPAYVLDSEPSALWIPLNGSERDALSTLIPRQVPHQGNGDQPATSSAAAKTRTAPAKLTNTLADTSVVHAIPGRIRLRVPALKTSPGLAEPLQRLLMDQPGITEVTVNDWCFSVTVICDLSKWTSDRLCMWLQLLNVAEVASYKTAKEVADQVQGPTDEAGDELWYSSAGICLVLLIEPLAAPFVPLLLLASALPMLKRAHRSLAEDGKLNVDVLDASATSLLVVQGAFPMALFMVWLINVADVIRDLTMMRSKKAIEEILGFQNIEAWVVRDGQKIRVSVAEVQLGETVVVYPGERIAVDGTVLSGKALVDQAALTGESVPVEKEEGAPVYAATVVREGKLYICAERIGNATEAAQILRLVEAAPARETKIQNYAVKWANDLVPYSFVGGAIGAVMGGGLTGAAAVLVVDYGTGIRIAAPTTVLSAMTKAIRNGILIKGGRALENLAEVDAVVFDKTGTLTTGHPDVLEVVPVNSSTVDEVLALAAAAELRLTHPVANAIVRAAEARHVTIPERTTSDYSLGLGVEAIVNDSVVLVGSPRFMTLREVILSPEVQGHISRMQQQAISPLCVAQDGAVIGLLAVSDPVRPEARDVVQALRDRGIKHIVMLTGDHTDVARRIAAELGITEFLAEVFPGDKSKAVQRLQREGYKVAVVGDGVNDSPMLAYADVGIAVEGGTEAARETAPVVLLHGGLWKVPLAIDIGRETVALIKQNWNIIAIPNTIAAGLACIALLGPIGATLLSNGSAIIATLNGLRPIMEQQPIKVVSHTSVETKLLPSPAGEKIALVG